MTHDELLAKIDSWIAIPETIKGDRKTWKALRAVVELHKPFSDGDCQECTRPFQVRYPCPSIQAIEKELK